MYFLFLHHNWIRMFHQRYWHWLYFSIVARRTCPNGSVCIKGSFGYSAKLGRMRSVLRSSNFSTNTGLPPWYVRKIGWPARIIASAKSSNISLIQYALRDCMESKCSVCGSKFATKQCYFVSAASVALALFQQMWLGTIQPQNALRAIKEK